MEASLHAGAGQGKGSGRLLADSSLFHGSSETLVRRTEREIPDIRLVELEGGGGSDRRRVVAIDDGDPSQGPVRDTQRPSAPTS